MKIMEDDRIANIDTRPWILLRNVNHIMGLVHDKELENLDITTRQTVVLGLLKRIGSDTKPAEISRRLSRKPSSISNILVRMEKKKLITRVPSTENKNHLCIALTELGKQKYQAARKRDVIKHILSVLSDAELGHFRDSLMKLRDSALSELGYNPNKRTIAWD